jgi:DNA repair exonuclease SbcCD ATPase subunit
LDSKISEVQTQFNNIENSNETLSSKVDSVTSKLNTQLVDIQNKVNDSQATIDNKINNVVNNRITDATNTLDSKISEVQTQFNNIENSNETLSSKVDSVTSKLNTQLADIQNRMKSSQGTIANIDNKINTEIQNITKSIETKLLNNEQVDNQRFKDINDQLQEINKLFIEIDDKIQKQQINSRKDEPDWFDSYKSKIDQNTDKISGIRKNETDISTLNEQFKTLSESIESSKNKLTGVMDSLKEDNLNNTIQKQITISRKNEPEWFDTYKSTIDQNTGKISGIKKNETDISTLNEQFKTLSESIEASKNQLTGVMDSLNEDNLNNTIQKQITISRKNEPEWFDTYKSTIDQNTGKISGIQKNETDISTLNEQFKTLSESIESSKQQLSGLTSILSEDTLKNLAQASDISDRLDALKTKYELSEIVTVDPQVFIKYDNFERELKTFADQLASQQQQINQSLNPYVSNKWDNVVDELKPYVMDYINKKFVEEISDSIRT